MATKKTEQNEPQRIPLEPCESWEAAAILARDALAYIISDAAEAGGNRVKAAELLLLYALGRPGTAGPGDPGGEWEEWLTEVQKTGLSPRL